ncbi:MAG: hypothetical protein NTW30_05930 [Candidatus Aenigmarchaeota archaeon]|nr:hypothetical protein [Candidatus Aenigmarchaeota archaeon]
MMDTKHKIAVVIVVLGIFVIGFTAGYLVPRDVHIQVLEASGKYVAFFDEMQEYCYPFNETDNVTMFSHGTMLLINHTTPNEDGMHFFNIGFDSDGFPIYITQYRDSR